ncbi:MAG: hypothetical protein IPG74_03465 [Flavobacteriales bacterium]|nr:hypothetical protein [Flavobacteriales bacterium]
MFVWVIAANTITMIAAKVHGLHVHDAVHGTHGTEARQVMDQPVRCEVAESQAENGAQ